MRAPHSPFLQKQRCLQIGVRCAKARFCLRERIAREICFKLIKQISANLGETRAAFPSCHVATRRRRASGARSLPPSPRTLVAPFPQKSHTASRVAIFGDPIIGAHLLLTGANSPSSPKPQVYGYLGALFEKRGSQTRSKLSDIYHAHHRNDKKDEKQPQIDKRKMKVVGVFSFFCYNHSLKGAKQVAQNIRRRSLRCGIRRKL